MTQKDLNTLKEYLDIKVGNCSIDEISAADIYDMMRLNCLQAPIDEGELDKLAWNEYQKVEDKDDFHWTRGFKEGYHLAKNE